MNIKEIVKLTKPLNVLYVEDEEDLNQKTVDTILSEMFNNVDIAVNGLDALEKYNDFYKKNNSYYDFVITDINMPKLNGIELCKMILKKNKDQAITVISAHNDPKNLQQLIDLGIKSFLHKPIDFDSLVKEFSKVAIHIKKKNEFYQNLKQIEELNKELDSLVNSFDKYVIASRTDKKGIITYASKAYEIISGYSQEELIGKPHNIVRHPDMPKEAFKDMWDTIQSGKVWIGEVKNRRKDGSFYWVKATIGPYYDNNNKLIGYSAIREDITSKKEAEDLHNKVNDLLNNAGQGFLSFDSSLKIENSYSKECVRLFMKEIAGSNISTLLFSQDLEKKELFEFGLKKIVQEHNQLAKELLLSLLPAEHTLNNKILNLEYKLLSDERFMLILTDITEKKKLEKKIQIQNNIQKMIVSVVSDKNEFIELKIDFDNFVFGLKNYVQEGKTAQDNATQILRELHTYKGLFAQKELIYTVKAIHELESKINAMIKNKTNNHEELKKILLKAELDNQIQKDLDILTKVLGKKYFSHNRIIEIEVSTIDQIENNMLSLVNKIDKPYQRKLNEILSDIHHLKEQSLKELLSSYPSLALKTAEELNKAIYPFEIGGDNSVVASETMKPFIKSLVHLFRNSIDHGIENAETRLERNKDEIGTIRCGFEQKGDLVSIKIEDDGGGIDIERVVSKAIKENIYTFDEIQKLAEDEKLRLIFHDSFSTKELVSELSGRGAGLGAVKAELDKLEGKLSIENKPAKGVAFTFEIPIKRQTKTQIFDKHVLKLIGARVKSFMNEDMGIELLETKKEMNYINDYEPSKFTSAIGISGDINTLATFSFDNSLINKLSAVFVPDGFSKEETMEMIKDIPTEVANTVLGLALQGFPDEGEDITITPPFLIGTEELKKALKKSNFIAIKIQTKAGNIICSLIDRRNSRRQQC